MFELKDLPSRFQKKIISDLQYLLDREIPGLEQIYLFGSVARGDYKWDSDVDLAIITKDTLTDRALRGEIADVLGMPIDGITSDVVFRTCNNHSMSSVFDQVFERDKVLLWSK